MRAAQYRRGVGLILLDVAHQAETGVDQLRPALIARLVVNNGLRHTRIEPIYNSGVVLRPLESGPFLFHIAGPVFGLCGQSTLPARRGEELFVDRPVRE